MDTLHDRLAELAEDAPTAACAPAAELWARGRRAHRRRAAAVAATLLVAGAVGIGIGVRLSNGDGNRSGLEPAGTVGISLPIDYPVGEELPDLGITPGRLAAIWVAPRVGGGAPEAVGLVAETGTFGTLPIGAIGINPDDPYYSPVALSADGRRIAYTSRTARQLVVRDLVSGDKYSAPSEFKTRDGFYWVDATHLLGIVWAGGDGDGWLWEPDTATAPKLVNPYRLPYGGTDGYDIPTLPPGVVTAGSPERVTFAADLIAAALDADGGAS